MSRDHAYLLDVLAAAKLAIAYVSGKSREEFRHDLQCQDAVIRRLEIMAKQPAACLTPRAKHSLSCVGVR